MRSQTWLAMFVFLFATAAHAQVACKLLQPAELESTLKEWASGGKAKEFAGSTYADGSTSMDTCTSEIVRPNGNLVVTVVVIKNYPMDGADAIRTRDTALGREG